MADPQAIASQFVPAYYQTFDSNRGGLAALYQPESELLFEGQQFQGVEAIIKKLTELPFQTVQHSVTTIDACLTQGLLLIVVMGQLKADNDPVMGFSQTFLLKQIGDSLFVIKDVFRLSLHHQ